MRRLLPSVVLLAAALMCGGLVSNASAVQTLYEVTLTVPNISPLPDSAVVLITNTGNSIKTVAAKSPWIVSAKSIGNGVVLKFSAKLVQGTTVKFHFDADFNNCGFGGGSWLNGNTTIAALQAANFNIVIKNAPATPGVSSIGLVLLSLLTLGSGIYIIGRRRSATA